MPRGAMLVNVGRGKHVVDEDLIKALDTGQLSYAALDALWPEPLPSGKPPGAPDRIANLLHRLPGRDNCGQRANPLFSHSSNTSRVT